MKIARYSSACPGLLDVTVFGSLPPCTLLKTTVVKFGTDVEYSPMIKPQQSPPPKPDAVTVFAPDDGAMAFQRHMTAPFWLMTGAASVHVLEIVSVTAVMQLVL